jgi:hypothetical protein
LIYLNLGQAFSDGNLATFQFLYRVALNTAAREMLDDIRGLRVSDEQKVVREKSWARQIFGTIGCKWSTIKSGTEAGW